MPWEYNNSDHMTWRFKSGNLGMPGTDRLPGQDDVLRTDRRAVRGNNSRSPPWRDGSCFCPLTADTTPDVGSTAHWGMDGGGAGCGRRTAQDSQLWPQPPGPPRERRVPSASRFHTHRVGSIRGALPVAAGCPVIYSKWNRERAFNLHNMIGQRLLARLNQFENYPIIYNHLQIWRPPTFGSCSRDHCNTSLLQLSR